MQSVKNDISRERNGIQSSDVALFFEVAKFFTAYQRHKFSILKVLFNTEIKNFSNTYYRNNDFFVCLVSDNSFFLVLYRLTVKIEIFRILWTPIRVAYFKGNYVVL